MYQTTTNKSPWSVKADLSHAIRPYLDSIEGSKITVPRGRGERSVSKVAMNAFLRTFIDLSDKQCRNIGPHGSPYSLQQIGRESTLSPASAEACAKRAVADGWLVIEKRHGGPDTPQATTYRMQIPADQNRHSDGNGTPTKTVNMTEMGGDPKTVNVTDLDGTKTVMVSSNQNRHSDGTSQGGSNEVTSPTQGFNRLTSNQGPTNNQLPWDVPSCDDGTPKDAPSGDGATQVAPSAQERLGRTAERDEGCLTDTPLSGNAYGVGHPGRSSLPGAPEQAAPRAMSDDASLTDCAWLVIDYLENGTPHSRVSELGEAVMEPDFPQARQDLLDAIRSAPTRILAALNRRLERDPEPDTEKFHDVLPLDGARVIGIRGKPSDDHPWTLEIGWMEPTDSGTYRIPVQATFHLDEDGPYAVTAAGQVVRL